MRSISLVWVIEESFIMLTQLDLLSLAAAEVQFSDVPDVKRNEVLVDNRDQGSFQQ